MRRVVWYWFILMFLLPIFFRWGYYCAFPKITNTRESDLYISLSRQNPCFNFIGKERSNLFVWDGEKIKEVKSLCIELHD